MLVRMAPRQEALETAILPIIDALGLRWIGLQCFSQRGHTLLKLYIDKLEGNVSCDDCERVSRQVNAVLGVEDLVQGDYLLEVSSPGLDRLLFTLPQCREHMGKVVTMRLLMSMEGQRNFKGKLCVEGDQIGVQLDNKVVMFPFIDVDEVRLVPEW